MSLKALLGFLSRRKSDDQIVDELVTSGKSIGEIAIWDKFLSAEEVEAYFTEYPTEPKDMPAFPALKRWSRLTTFVPAGMVPKFPWERFATTSKTGTVLAWIREEGWKPEAP